MRESRQQKTGIQFPGLPSKFLFAIGPETCELTGTGSLSLNATDPMSGSDPDNLCKPLNACECVI